MKSLPPLETTGITVFFGTLYFGLAMLFEEPWRLPVLHDPVFWWNVLLLSICVTFLGFLFYFRSVSHLGAIRTGGFINLVPVIGTAMSVLILGEVLYWTFSGGLLLVVTGTTLINGGGRGVDVELPETGI